MTSDFNVRIPSSRVMKDVTLNVELTGVRAWKWRMRLGVWLIKLAARVLGCGINVELE